MKFYTRKKENNLIKIILICAGAVLSLIGLAVVIKKLTKKCPACGMKTCDCGDECECLDGEECCCECECEDIAEEAAEEVVEKVEETAEDISEEIRKKADDLFF